ncbi:MAG: hypothetical protein ACXVYI_06700 [Mycobacterium sp.]
MELKWWPVVGIGLLCLAVAVGAAALLPMPRVRRVLRPLAHTDRLTRLPEYVRVYRVYFFSVLVTGVLALATFLTALTASARPTSVSSSRQAFDAAHPEDIMLCVGEPVTDSTTAGFLRYYGAYAKRMNPRDTRRIGLTSTTLRVIPLTRDHRYVADRLGSLARLARIQEDVNKRKPLPGNDRAELDAGIQAFSRPVNYVDYAPTVSDVLALCMTGFPAYQANTEHRRQLIYLGYRSLREPSEARPSLFTGESVRRMAEQRGVQVNAILRSDTPAPTTNDDDVLRATAEASGGRFLPYSPAAAAPTDTDPALSHDLDQIAANAPEAERPGGAVMTSLSVESPETLLVACVVAAALLSLSSAVLRR